MGMTEQESKYLKLAQRAREENNAEDAKKYYDMVRMENPDNCEARFFYPIYKLWDGKKGEWASNFLILCNNIEPGIKDISEADMPLADKEKLLADVFEEIKPLPRTCNKVLNEIKEPLSSCGRGGIYMFYNFGDAIEKYFPNNGKLMNLACTAWKEGVDLQKNWPLFGADKSFPEKYTEKIQKLDPAYTTPKTHSGCLSSAKVSVG